VNHSGKLGKPGTDGASAVFAPISQVTHRGARIDCVRLYIFLVKIEDTL
jgi:hypothetical protein